jgi:hypothetical protein
MGVSGVSWALGLAIYGACTGTAGAIAGLANRRDAVWARRGRTRDLRPNLEPLRDVLAEAKVSPLRTVSLTANRQFQAHVQAIDEAVDRCPDRRMRKYLKEIKVRCLTVINSASASEPEQISYALTIAIDRALLEITAALKRLEMIDRRAPS